jgi:hypothetical protein
MRSEPWRREAALDRIAQGFSIGFSASGMSSACTGPREPEHGAPPLSRYCWWQTIGRETLAGGLEAPGSQRSRKV